MCLPVALPCVYPLHYHLFTFCATVCLPFALPSVYVLYYRATFCLPFVLPCKGTTAVSGVRRIPFRAKTCRASVYRRSTGRPNECPSAVVRLSIVGKGREEPWSLSARRDESRCPPRRKSCSLVETLIKNQSDCHGTSTMPCPFHHEGKSTVSN